MADTTGAPEPQGDKIPLDIGKVIGDSFSVYFKTLPVFFLLIFTPFLFLDLMMNQYIQPMILSGVGVDNLNVILMFVGVFVAFLLMLVLIQATMIYIAVSVRVGQGISFGKAIQAALRAFFPIVVIAIVFFVIFTAIYLGAIAFFIANTDLLWLLFLIVPVFIVVAFIFAAMFYVFMPAAVFENAGFGALARSLYLTRGSRGAIIGQMILLAIIVIVISLILATILGGVMVGMMAGNLESFASGGQMTFPWWYSFLNASVNALSTPLSLIPPVIVYARLKEIKEGGQADDLLQVFE